MLSCILNSETAISVNIRIIRVFTRLREMLLSNQDTLLKLEQLDKKIVNMGFDVKMHDGEIETIFELIKEIMPKRRNRSYRGNLSALKPGWIKISSPIGQGVRLPLSMECGALFEHLESHHTKAIASQIYVCFAGLLPYPQARFGYKRAGE